MQVIHTYISCWAHFPQHHPAIWSTYPFSTRHFPSPYSKNSPSLDTVKLPPHKSSRVLPLNGTTQILGSSQHPARTTHVHQNEIPFQWPCLTSRRIALAWVWQAIPIYQCSRWHNFPFTSHTHSFPPCASELCGAIMRGLSIRFVHWEFFRVTSFPLPFLY